MSIDATNWAWSQRDISPSEKLLLLSLADRAGESHEAWPSWRRLMLDTGLDRKTIHKSLTSLQSKGKIMKTGDRKSQVFIYRLIGIVGRDDHEKLSTTSPKNGTGSTLLTSTKNGTGTSTKNGTGTSTKNGTQKHKGNPKRNPNAKPLPFSTPEYLESFVTERVTALRKGYISEYTKQIMYYVEKSRETRDALDSINIAIALIRKGEWKIPSGFNGITSKSIRQKEETQEAIKSNQQIADGIMTRKIRQEAMARSQHVSSPQDLNKTQKQVNEKYVPLAQRLVQYREEMTKCS